jgi:hypothetical protein
MRIVQMFRVRAITWERPVIAARKVGDVVQEVQAPPRWIVSLDPGQIGLVLDEEPSWQAGDSIRMTLERVESFIT